MHVLSQRLKELPRATFEQLCFNLIQERFPTSHIHHVEGESGDEGVDTFCGSLKDGPTIWQAKAFRRLGTSQQQQIRRSLRRAIKSFKPKRWVLCIPIDLTIDNHRWFQRLQRSFAPLDISLLDGSNIVAELFHRKALRESYFPEAMLSLSEIRSIMTKTGECSSSELAALTTENAEQFIERFCKPQDARLNYQVIVSPEPVSTHAQPQPGALFSVTSGSLSINAYPRDIEALRLNPPKVSLRFKDAGVDKFASFVRTGKRQSFGTGEVELLSNDFGFHAHGNLPSMTLGPRVIEKPIPAKVIFGSPANHVVYDYIEFTVDRAGAEEIQLTSASARLPFTLSVIARQAGSGTFHVSEHLAGARMIEVEKWLAALTALKDTMELTIIHLEHNQPLFRAKINSNLTELNPEPWFAAFIVDAAQIAREFVPDLTMPESITRQERETISTLKDLMESRFDSVSEITGSIIKESGKEEQFYQMCRGQATPGLRLTDPSHPFPFGGRIINPGPLTLEFERTEVIEPDQTLARYQALPVGSELEVKFRPLGAPSVTLEKHRRR